jgi:hypothetical protein
MSATVSTAHRLLPRRAKDIVAVPSRLCAGARDLLACCCHCSQFTRNQQHGFVWRPSGRIQVSEHGYTEYISKGLQLARPSRGRLEQWQHPSWVPNSSDWISLTGRADAQAGEASGSSHRVGPACWQAPRTESRGLDIGPCGSRISKACSLWNSRPRQSCSGPYRRRSWGPVNCTL